MRREKRLGNDEWCRVVQSPCCRNIHGINLLVGKIGFGGDANEVGKRKSTDVISRRRGVVLLSFSGPVVLAGSGEGRGG